jgi:hypothetical protein
MYAGPNPQEQQMRARIASAEWMEENMPGIAKLAWKPEDEWPVDGTGPPMGLGFKGLMYRGKWLVSPERQERTVRLFWVSHCILNFNPACTFMTGSIPIFALYGQFLCGRNPTKRAWSIGAVAASPTREGEAPDRFRYDRSSGQAHRCSGCTADCSSVGGSFDSGMGFFFLNSFCSFSIDMKEMLMASRFPGFESMVLVRWTFAVNPSASWPFDFDQYPTLSRANCLHQRLLLKNPFIPLAFRLTVLAFSAASLGIAATIYQAVYTVNHDNSANNNCATRASTYMAICVGTVAIPYLGYVTWDEYMSKPYVFLHLPPVHHSRLPLLPFF